MKVITLDSRRRCSLGRIGYPEHTRYEVAEMVDGKILLTPVAVVPITAPEVNDEHPGA